MRSIKQILIIALANYKKWKNNPQIFLTFGLGFVMCFLLSDKLVAYVDRFETTTQLFETFIWTFGDTTSILFVSLCLLLLFSDLPNMDNEVPLLLVRTTRFSWVMGQIVYVVSATFIFTLFVLVSTCLLAASNSYTANLWSDTAAIMGYSGIGRNVGIPAFVKVLERTFPYQCTLHIFGLMLGYSTVLSGIILVFNMWKKNMGMVAGIVFSGIGVVLNPEFLSMMLEIPRERMVEANILFGWISPLNHATYYMHNFGYDMLPKLWVSYVVFGVMSLVLYLAALIRIRHYSFNFTGTKG